MLVTTKEMFEKSMKEGFAIGAFNVNNMEIVQAIVDAANETKSPVILQASSSAIKYARIGYLMKMVEAAVEEYPDIPIAIHLDHGPDFETAKICDSVLECIFQNKKLLFSCSSWQNNVLQSSQHSAEIDAIKKNLNNFWKNKNYSEYLSYFLKYRQALANYPNLVIFERRAEYIRRHMVNN